MFGFFSPVLNLLEIILVSAIVGAVTTSVGLVLLGRPRLEEITRTQLALAAPIGFASLAIFALFCRGLFGSVISESVFQISVLFCIVTSMGISVLLYGKRLLGVHFSRVFLSHLVSIIGFMVVYFALSGALNNGIYSLPLRNGSDHIGYIQGAWFLLSDLFQAPNISPSLSLLEMKSSILVPNDDRMLAYAATAVASLFIFGQWQWSYMIVAGAVFGFLGNYYAAISRNRSLRVPSLVICLFLLSQFFDILQMGYLGKGLFYLFAILAFGELLSSKETKQHLLLLMGLILGSVYSTMASMLLLTLFSACIIFSTSLISKKYRIRDLFYVGSMGSGVLGKLGFLSLGALASTGWTRNFQNPIDLKFNPSSNFTPIEILGNSWDFSWWGAPGQLGAIGLVALILFLTALAVFIIFELRGSNLALVSTLMFCLALSLLFLISGGSWASYQLVNLSSLTFLLAVSIGQDRRVNANA